MSKTIDFFKPSWKKLYWFILVVFVAQMYNYLLIGFVPTSIIANFVNFILNPANVLFENFRLLDSQLTDPVANTLNIIWQYLIGTILAKEISKDKE